MDDEQQTTKEPNKICGVCADRALGFNFNAVSCESCKAFFRRNALKNKDFQCPFTENCVITPVTRRFCQKCRLDKCFAIGMKKEYIMTEEDKIVKRHKIEQNRAKKRPPTANHKVGKMKREVADENSLDNDTSVSMNSVVSTASSAADTHCWDSDRKRGDGDDPQTAAEATSLVASAGCSSPCSSFENREVAASATPERLKNLVAVGSTYLEDIEDSGAVGRLDAHDPKTFGLCDERPDNNFVASASASACDSNCESDIDGSTVYTENITDNFGELKCEEKNERTTVNDESKNVCLKGTDMIMRFIEDPNLVTKFFSNPSLVSKVFQDKNLITRLMTDPSTVTRLASDPQISKFIEDNDVSGIIDSSYESSKSRDENFFNENVTTSNTVEVIDKKYNRVGNPILTNLITPIKMESCVNGNGSSNSNRELEKKFEVATTTTTNVIENVVRTPISATSIDSILQKAIKLEYSSYSALGGNQTSRELNDAERAKLNELIVANKALLAPLDDDITNLVGEECPFKGNGAHSDPMLLDVINLTAIAIRRLIKMSKKINAFKNMCQEDQLALLKGGCTEMLILRSALNYDPDKEIWKIPHSLERMSNIKVDVLKEAKGNLYEEHSRFVRTFDPRWRDENIILILSAIALFSPERPRVVHRDVIKLEQNSYYYLLRRYLESVYPGCEAKSTFLKLIQKISELHSLNDEVVGVYLNVNPSSVEPLLIEIFDLKQ